MKLMVTWDDIRGLKRMDRQIRDLNEKFPRALPRLMNQVGDRARTKVVRALTSQTGLDRQVIRRAVDTQRAFTGKLAYDMRTKGGNIRLKYLKPAETAQGVVARPFGQKTLYPGSFMRGGVFPDRKPVSAFGGHVFHRLNRSGSRITHSRSGVVIPAEMVRGITAEAFQTEVRTTLPARVEALAAKLLG
ncbi:Hypothetical protein NGAL_HAMBI1146_58560 [Neorhizobium galegae bv. officinalis]|nr:Hypothetical protein NGAL_HAMBI1146_58560 [Neorhizobium galegae bv. officinalis]